eukprot:5479874-Pyramimonas_sp.AAC.1
MDTDDRLGSCLGCCGPRMRMRCLGAGHSIGVDIDDTALEVAQENINGFEDMYIDLVQCDIEHVGGLGLRADTVLMNPPFGTRRKVGTFSQFATKSVTSSVWDRT